MEIRSIETFAAVDNCIVRVTSADGAVGIGQTSPGNADISAQVLHRQLAPLVLGMDDGEPAVVAGHCIEATYKYPGTYVCRALCGIDTAIWDLLGKRADKPVCELLGGRAQPMPVYASSMRRDLTPQAEVERMLYARDRFGFSAFKLKIGKRMGSDLDEWPGRTETLATAMRKSLGDSARLLADANGAYSPVKAIEIGRMLEGLGFAHFEEPCPFHEIEQIGEVAAALAIPVAAGEQDYLMPHWHRIFRQGCIDIAQPDIGYVGGFSRALEVGRLAKEFGLECTPHNSGFSMLAVFSLHLSACLLNAGPFTEFSIEGDPGYLKLYAPALEVKDGKATLPTGPGWGVEPDLGWLERAAFQSSELR